LRDDEQDPAEEISSPEALAGALEYLHAEARLAGFYLVAHLILVAATAIEDELSQDSKRKQPPSPHKEYPPALRLLKGGLAAEADLPDNLEGETP
jgi:hypothetical protein